MIKTIELNQYELDILHGCMEVLVDSCLEHSPKSKERGGYLVEVLATKILDWKEGGNFSQAMVTTSQDRSMMARALNLQMGVARDNLVGDDEDEHWRFIIDTSIELEERL